MWYKYASWEKELHSSAIWCSYIAFGLKIISCVLVWFGDNQTMKGEFGSYRNTYRPPPGPDKDDKGNKINQDGDYVVSNPKADDKKDKNTPAPAPAPGAPAPAPSK